jgi:hypothetical protein
MTDPWEFKIGVEVTCSDEECGILRRTWIAGSTT